MAQLADLEITVGVDAATAALVKIREITDPERWERDPWGAGSLATLREIHDIAAATLQKAQAKPRVRHA